MELSIIIPAYLEEENLRVLLPRIKEAAAGFGNNAEIIVVDSQTLMDNTRPVCASLGVSCISREGGNNYGDAVRTGIAAAQGKYILFMDADGSHSPEFIKNLWEAKGDNDIVIASRYVEGGGSDNTAVLIFMSWVVNFVYAVFFNLQCKDVSNSFKLYKGALLKNITLKCNNFDIIEEILIKLKRKKADLRIFEIPYLFKARMFGATKRNLIAFSFSYLYTLIKLKLS